VSLLTIALLAIGYVVVVVFVLAMLRTASRADEAAEREQRAAVGPLTDDGGGLFVRERHSDREIVGRRTG
jgi:hypothetical protein